MGEGVCSMSGIWWGRRYRSIVLYLGAGTFLSLINVKHGF